MKLATAGKLRPDDEISEDKSSWLPAEQYFPDQFDQHVLTTLSRKPVEQSISVSPSSFQESAVAEQPVSLKSLSEPMEPATEPPSGIADFPELPPSPHYSVISDLCHLIGALTNLKANLSALVNRIGTVFTIVSIYSLLAYIGPLILFMRCHPALKNELHAGCIGLIATGVSLVLSLIVPRFCPCTTTSHRSAAIVVSCCLHMNSATLFGSFFSLQHGLTHPLEIPRGVTLAVLLLINALLAASSYQMLSSFVCRLLRQSTRRCLITFIVWQLLLYLAYSYLRIYFL